MNWDRVFALTTFFSDLVKQANVHQSPWKLWNVTWHYVFLMLSSTSWSLRMVTSIRKTQQESVQTVPQVPLMNVMVYGFLSFIFVASFSWAYVWFVIWLLKGRSQHLWTGSSSIWADRCITLWSEGHRMIDQKWQTSSFFTFSQCHSMARTQNFALCSSSGGSATKLLPLAFSLKCIIFWIHPRQVVILPV